MNKKPISLANILVITGIVVVIVVLIVSALNNSRKFPVEISYPNEQGLSIMLYRAIDSHDEVDNIMGDEGNFVQKLEQPSAVELKNGTYAAIVLSDKYKKEATFFTVDGEGLKVDVKLNLSQSAIDQLLAKERSLITRSIRQYIRSSVSYSIVDVSIYEDGDWSYAKLESTNKSVDSYYVILQKKGDYWEIKSEPFIAFDKNVSSELPNEVVRYLDIKL